MILPTNKMHRNQKDSFDYEFLKLKLRKQSVLNTIFNNLMLLSLIERYVMKKESNETRQN